MGNRVMTDKRFKHGDVVMSNPRTSNWCKWIVLVDDVVLLDAYPNSSVKADDPMIGLFNTIASDIEHLGNIFDNPGLIVAGYYKHMNRDNFKLYLSI